MVIYQGQLKSYQVLYLCVQSFLNAKILSFVTTMNYNNALFLPFDLQA
jgi:hypothetical protein